MSEKNIRNNILNAAKWSTITEIAVKFVTPVINMALARILAPEEFGVVATATMIVSFADMFTDAGFQKYLIQKEFDNEEIKNKNANVAFWTNLIISLIFCFLIYLFKDSLAILVGNPGLGSVIFISSLQLLLTAFSSIQMALYRRNFDFKTLFIVRIISVSIPLIVTLPLAYLGFSYWSIIIGNLAMQLSNSLILTAKSKWKPRLYYSFDLLKEMFSFSMWSLIEAISIWLTSWADTFVIGTALTPYYLGLYKTATSMVNSLLAIITGATTPVLFSSLSRLQNDDKQFNFIFLKFQRLVSAIVFPIGVGVYLFSDLATRLMLGNDWLEASNLIGIWALTSAVMIVFGNYCSEVYRAKGLPKLSFIAQILHLVVMIPVCIIAAKQGFWVLVYARSLVRLQFILVHFILMQFVIKFSVWSMIVNVAPTLLSSVLMGRIGFYIKGINGATYWQFITIGLCILIYFALLLLFPSVKQEALQIKRQLLENKKSGGI